MRCQISRNRFQSGGVKLPGNFRENHKVHCRRFSLAPAHLHTLRHCTTTQNFTALPSTLGPGTPALLPAPAVGHMNGRLYTLYPTMRSLYRSMSAARIASASVLICRSPRGWQAARAARAASARKFQFVWWGHVRRYFISTEISRFANSRPPPNYRMNF